MNGLRAASVMAVDDDALVLTSLVAVLQSFGLEVLAASSGTAALAIARDRLPDVIVSDFNMPGMSGLELIASMRTAGVAAPAIIVSGTQRNGDLNVLKQESERLGIVATLMKPFVPRELRAAIDSAMHGGKIPGLDARRAR